MTENVLEFNDVYKSIGTVNILNGITFSIKKGITAILGPNGAGKTTTLRCLLGLLKPESGEIKVYGKNIFDLPEHFRGQISFLPQDDAGYKTLTAKQNIEFFIDLMELDKKKATDQMYELFSMLEMDHVLEQKFSVLSGGEKRALGLIRAVIQNRDLIILDEPTAGLDLERAVKVRQLIQSLADEGKTIILSSHIVSDIEQLSNEIIIMKMGKIVMQISKEDLILNNPGKKLDEIILSVLENNTGRN